MNLYKDLQLKNIEEILQKIKHENYYQLQKRGIQERTIFEWMIYLSEEFGELAQAISEHEYRSDDPEKIIKEGVQVATLTIKIIEFYLNKIKEA